MKTLLDLIRYLLVIRAFILSALTVVGAYFGSRWYYGEVEPVPERVLHYTPKPVVIRGAPEGRLSWADDSATRIVSTHSSSDGAVQAAEGMNDFSDYILESMAYSKVTMEAYGDDNTDYTPRAEIRDTANGGNMPEIPPYNRVVYSSTVGLH